MFIDDAAYQIFVAAITFNKCSPGGYGPSMPLAQIIQHDDIAPTIERDPEGKRLKSVG